MHIHDFLAGKAFLVLFFSCAYLLRFWIPRPLCFLADKRWRKWHLQPSFLAPRTWCCGFHRRRAVIGRPPASSSTSAPWFENVHEVDVAIWIRKAVIWHLGFSVWMMAAMVRSIENCMAPRLSPVMRFVRNRTALCKAVWSLRIFEQPGRGSGPHTIDGGKKRHKHSKLFRFHQLRPNDFDIKCLGCMDEILELCQGE